LQIGKLKSRNNMAKKKSEEEEYYKGVTFLAFQSGSPDEPSDRTLKLIANFTKDMQKESIRVYSVLQIGKPGGGGCPPGGCG
jgi:hypothetical protein